MLFYFPLLSLIQYSDLEMLENFRPYGLKKIYSKSKFKPQHISTANRDLMQGSVFRKEGLHYISKQKH